MPSGNDDYNNSHVYNSDASILFWWFSKDFKSFSYFFSPWSALNERNKISF
jgi:hypothetical protein